MRKFFSIVAALVCIVALGQKKPNINKAKAAFDKGELADAKTMIDQCIDYEKTKDKAKTWYYRGMIYSAIDTSTNDFEALKVAMESYNKSLELDPEQKTTSEFTGVGLENVDSKIQNYYGFYYNRAVESYQQEAFLEAAESFERASYIMPSDTNSLINAAYSAIAAEDDERAKKNFIKGLEAGMKDKNVYLRLYNYAVADEDLDKAYAILEDARAVHPNHIDFQKFQINILIQQDKVDEAKAGIEEAIRLEPENADLYFSLGVIQEEMKDLAAAKESYTKAVGFDNEHFNSNFNLGVMVFNESNELIKERNALSYKEEKKYAALSTQIDDKLNSALPYWEKLYSLKNDERTILETLQYIYTSLKMNDKAEKMTDELENLENGG